MPATVKSIDNAAELIDASTLRGDLRDALLDRLRAMPKPWTVMSQGEQQDMIDGVDRVARHLVVEATRILAANGRPVIFAQLESATVKDGIKAVLTMNQHDEQRHALMDAVGLPVLLVVSDHEQFMGEKAPAKPDPDQPTLPGAEGSDNVKPMKGR